MKTDDEFPFVLRGGYVIVAVLICALLVISMSTVFVADGAVSRVIALVATGFCLSMIWLAYRRTLSCRAIVLSSNELTVIYRSGQRVRFVLPGAIKDMNVCGPPHVQQPEYIQFTLENEKDSYFLNTDCFDRRRDLIMALEKIVPVTRLYSDGRIELLKLSKMSRGVDCVDIVGYPSDVRRNVRQSG